MPTVRRRELQYDLPAELIAQRPCEPRDAARLMVVDRAAGCIEHRVFRDLADYLDRGDCLVLNDTRVIPARFRCRRRSGGRVEALFVDADADAWRVLLRPSARLAVGERLAVENAETRLVLTARGERGEWSVRPEPSIEPMRLLERAGKTPLPPYIRRPFGPDERDAQGYQTVYARQAGAVAAPTAGLHFTPALLASLRDAGLRIAEVTLHVGPGTFAPIEVEDLADHRMQAERFAVPGGAAEVINAARSAGRRVVAVGSTTVRVLESFADGPIVAGSGRTDLFIHPSCSFRHVDRLITNFHLPESTLLAMVYAFGGVELIREAYAEAIRRRYRFYSFGDAMLIL